MDFLRPLFAVLLVTVAGTAQQQPGRAPATPELGANLPAQPVGPNDLIAVSIYDAPELSRTIRVGADGYIRLPMLKQRVKAQGLYPSELETAIVAALREEEILVDPFVTVTIAQYQSRPISVAGAVKMPLVFQAESAVTLLEAVARAQGLREDAGREILVSRSQPGPDGKPVMLTRRIPVRGLIDDADPELNMTLTGGEEITRSGSEQDLHHGQREEAGSVSGSGWRRHDHHADAGAGGRSDAVRQQAGLHLSA